MPRTLSIAVCLSDVVTLSDFITPMEILAAVNRVDQRGPDAGLGNKLRACMPSGEDVAVRFAFDYLAPSMRPVVGMAGLFTPTLNPTMTYEEAMARGKQFDIIWCPAGPDPDSTTKTHRFPPEEIEFIKRQAGGAQYMISVCTGAYQLALAGVLSGKRATTNKSSFEQIKDCSPNDIQWVAKARWVVDGNVWTSSGVSAGSDMALAFVEHLTNSAIARVIRGVVEVVELAQDDDPFAEFHGLL